MQLLTPPTHMDLNSRTRLSPPPVLRRSSDRVHPTRLHPIRCVSIPNHFAADRRHDWLSSCAILAGKVAAQNTDGNPVPVNGCPALDIVPVKSTPLPRQTQSSTDGDLAPAPLHGSKLRVAYRGIPGAYSESAVAKAYPAGEPIPCDQFEVAFQAVELWVADRAVLPVENSLGGSIHRNYDLLLRHRLHIVGEVQLPIHHCLLALPGVNKDSLRRVLSHPQALSQCENTLTRLGIASAALEATDCSAAAAEHVAANRLRDAAAIASSQAAEIYGLQVLANMIQDEPGNVTRFLVLAREPVVPRSDRPFKTSIAFAGDGEGEGTAALFKVLSALAFRDIGLRKIESRPHRRRVANGGRGRQFEYLFYVDFEASMAERRAQNAMADIQEFTSFLRVLGSYPIDVGA